MFITEDHWKSREFFDSMIPSQSSWPLMRLQYYSEWFVVDVMDVVNIDQPDGEAPLRNSRIFMFPGLVELEKYVTTCDIDSSSSIHAVFLVTPGHMNQSGGWEMDQLAAVWDAKEPIVRPSARIFETVDGRFYERSYVSTPIERLGERTLRLRFKPSMPQASEPHPTAEHSSQS